MSLALGIVGMLGFIAVLFVLHEPFWHQAVLKDKYQAGWYKWLKRKGFIEDEAREELK